MVKKVRETFGNDALPEQEEIMNKPPEDRLDIIVKDILPILIPRADGDYDSDSDDKEE
jgi:hypothetical protein